MRFGQDALQIGQVIRSDPYSYLTSGARWINHEWLAELLYALAYDKGGSFGLIALNLLFSLLIVALIYRRLRRADMGPIGAMLLTVGFGLVLRPGVLNVRPQVFTYLGLLLILLRLDAYTHADHALHPVRRKPAIQRAIALTIPVCFILAVWVNLHGGVLAGVALLWIWGLAQVATSALHRQSPDVGVVAGLAFAPLALLANPYGPDLIAFLLRTATVARPEILEWQRVRVGELWGMYWLGAVLVTLLAIGVSRRPRRAALLTALAVIALLPLSAVRHIPLFAVAAPVLAADHFADLWERLARPARQRWPLGAQAQRAGRLAALVGAALVAAVAAPRLQAITIQPASAGFPVRAVAALKAAGVQGNMATEFNWGEYVIWRLGPAVKVSVDGRRETVYPEAIYRENLDFMAGLGQWDRLVDRPETELALVDRERPVFKLMRAKAGWTLAYADEAAGVFVRANSPCVRAIADVAPPDVPANGAGLTFP